MANRTVLVKDIDSLIEKVVKAGFSYRQLAKNAQCSQTQISLILKGERNPSPENAVKIEETKQELLNDREFREELLKRYNEDDERFINKTLKEASKNTFDTSKN